MDPENTVARLNQAIDKMADEVKLDDAVDARTKYEAMDVVSQLESLRTRLWPPMLTMRLAEELRQVAERAVSLPEGHILKRSSAQRRIVTNLQTQRRLARDADSALSCAKPGMIPSGAVAPFRAASGCGL